jgi:transposase
VARSTRDTKSAELAASRTLNRHPERVSDEAFSESEFFDARDLVQVKYEMVRKVAEGAPVARAASTFGMSRQSYYSAAEALAEGGLAALLPAKPGPRAAHKLSDEVVDHLEELRAAEPGLRSSELATVVSSRFNISVHPRSVERALARREAARRPKSGGSSG